MTTKAPKSADLALQRKPIDLSSDGTFRQRAGAAETVVAQAKEQAVTSSSVVALDNQRLRPATIAWGAKSISITLPQTNGAFAKVDVTFLRAVANLMRPLAEGLRTYGSQNSIKSTQGRISELRTGLVSHLIDKKATDLGLDDLSRPFWLGFIAWLDTRRVPSTQKLLHPKTRSLTFGATAAILRCLLIRSEYRASAMKALHAQPSSRWSIEEQETTPRETLGADVIQVIDQAVIKDLKRIGNRLERDERAIRTGMKSIELGDFDLSDIKVCAAYLAKKYPDGIPINRWLRDHDPALYGAVFSCSSASFLGQLRLREMLYPKAMDIVPFVLALAIETNLNAASLLELEWSDISEEEIFGEPIFRFYGKKRRASQDPHPPVPARAVSDTLNLLRRLTSRLRPALDPRMADRLFVYDRLRQKGTAFGASISGFQHLHHFSVCLREFCEVHGLPQFGLAQIRATLSDEISIRHGIVVASQVLGHQSVDTTEKHYVKPGTRWRGVEYLGRMVWVMERWWESNGRIDPRRRIRSAAMDKGAATPGFFCFDPFDSPIAGQKKGRICSAYGYCPSCPLAAAYIDDPPTVALYLGLKESLYSAQGLMAAETWLARVAGAILDLESLLKHVRPSVMRRALKFKVTLPPVE